MKTSKKKQAKQKAETVPATTRFPFITFDDIGDTVEGKLNGVWKGKFGFNLQIEQVNVNVSKAALLPKIQAAIQDGILKIGSYIQITYVDSVKGKYKNDTKIYSVFVDGVEIKNSFGKAELSDLLKS